MKRLLLITAVLVSAATGIAQPQADMTRVKISSLPRLNVQARAYCGEMSPSLAVKHSVLTGNYFSHPEGTFYVGTGLDGYGTILTTLVAPLTNSVNFTEAGSVNPTWKQAGDDIDDATDKSYTFRIPYGGLFYAPYAVNGTDSFCVGTNNLYSRGIAAGDTRFTPYSAAGYTPYLNWGVIGSDTIHLLRPVDDKAAYSYNGNLYSNGAVWGPLSTDYMFGTGAVDYSSMGGSGIGDCYAAAQIFGKTAAPLYVERIVASGRTHTKPIKEDGQLVAYVTGVHSRTYSDGSIVLTPDINNIYDTLYANAADTIDFRSTYTINGKKTYEGKVLFSKKNVDELGTELIEPFIIPADSMFAVYITGFQDTTNIDFGIDGLHYPDEEKSNTDDILAGRLLTQNRGDDGVYTITYNGIAADIAVEGMYDGVIAPEENDFFVQDEGTKANVVRISNDGTSCFTDSAKEHGFNGAPVLTTLPWIDDEGYENYYIEDLPDWIRNVETTDVKYDDGKSANKDFNFYVLKFTATALPAGTTKRIATIHVVSDKGARSNDIILRQGDASIAAGLESVSADKRKIKKNARAYNLSGQEVNNSYKGIVIKNGDKLIQ